MTAPQTTRGRGLDPALRGVLVLAAVVILGLVLLAKAAPSSSTSTAKKVTAGNPTTTKPPRTTVSTAPPTTAGKVHPAAQVKVLVLNGTGGIPKVAGSNTDKIKGKGYNTLSPGNAATRPATAVFFATGYQPDAVEVAKVLGLPATAAAPVPVPPPAPEAKQANVVVVLGKDTPPAT